MIHFVCSGISVLHSWKQPSEGIIAAVNGAARYTDPIDWWAAGDRQCAYSPLLDPPTARTPRVGYLTDRDSLLALQGCGTPVYCHEETWHPPCPARRRFTAPMAAQWLLSHYPQETLHTYGVDLTGNQYAWGVGPPPCEDDGRLGERWQIEREAWVYVAKSHPKRVFGLPNWLMSNKWPKE